MPNHPFRIRLATLDDAPACAYVHHTSWVETYSALLPASHWDTDTLERRAASWQQSLDGGKSVTVAESGGQVIGIAITNPARALGEHEPVRELELSSLYVLSAHHGHGAGQALLDTVLPPGTSAQLWVAERNPRARRFYERNGFTPDGALFTDDSLGLDEIRLVR
jgi:GNAT superfamily N-acetyltransferase